MPKNTIKSILDVPYLMLQDKVADIAFMPGHMYKCDTTPNRKNMVNQALNILLWISWIQIQKIIATWVQ
jgi:hypothetical protein